MGCECFWLLKYGPPEIKFGKHWYRHFKSQSPFLSVDTERWMRGGRLMPGAQNLMKEFLEVCIIKWDMDFCDSFFLRQPFCTVEYCQTLAESLAEWWVFLFLYVLLAELFFEQLLLLLFFWWTEIAGLAFRWTLDYLIVVFGKHTAHFLFYTAHAVFGLLSIGSLLVGSLAVCQWPDILSPCIVFLLFVEEMQGFMRLCQRRRSRIVVLSHS